LSEETAGARASASRGDGIFVIGPGSPLERPIVTGCELLAAVEGLPCAIVPLAGDAPLRGLWRERGFLGVACLARKRGAPDPRFAWGAPVSSATAGTYPR